MTTTVTFPTSGDYVDALQDTQRCFTDPELVGCTIRTDRFGLPRPISGNFAGVFTADVAGGRRLAVKCFTRDVRDQQERYREIDAALHDVPERWKVDFRYVDSGILVRGKPYPILVMEWIDAEQLIPWIEDRLRAGDRAGLGRMADAFARLVESLEAAGLAHGDLQHGNLLVTPRGELKLIDYDGMYVPALRERPSMELGQPNYQHPRRTASDYGPWLDRFSSRVIHLSLAALSADPTLWQRWHKEGGEYLLLQKYDLEDPATSPGLASLGSLGSSFQARVAELGDLVRRPLEEIPAMAASGKVRASSSRSAGVAQDSAMQTGEAAGPDEPSPTSGVFDVPTSANSWLDDHLPPPTPVALPRPGWTARSLWYASLLVTVLLALVGAVEPVVIPVAVLYVGVVTLAWRAGFAALPESKEKSYQRSVVRSARAQEKQLEAQLRWQIAARVESIESYHRELALLTDRRVQIDRDAATEHARIGRWRDEELVRLLRERSRISDWKSRELRRRTESVVMRHITDELSRHRIGAAQIRGIGRAVAEELEAAGIRTAADFVGIRIQSKRNAFGPSSDAYIVLRNGQALKVPAVGASRARRLDTWRESLVHRARMQMPAQLTAPIPGQIEAEAVNRQASLASRETAVSSAADVQRRTAASQTQAQRDALLADEQSARSSHATAVAAIDRDCAACRESVVGAQRHVRAEERALDAYRDVRFGKYLVSLTIGRAP